MRHLRSVFVVVGAAAVLVTGCQGGPGPVLLLIRSNAPVQPTAQELHKDVVALRKDWEHAKRQVLALHVARLSEMAGIEADIGYLGNALTIDVGQAGDEVEPELDQGRLRALLAIELRQPDDDAFLREVRQALGPQQQDLSPAQYVERLATLSDAAQAQGSEEAVRFLQLWDELGAVIGQPGASPEDVVAVVSDYETWEDLVWRYTRPEGEQLEERLYTGRDLVLPLIDAARDLDLAPPALELGGRYTRRVEERLRFRRKQFFVIDKLLSKLVVIAADQELFLANDVDAIHWDEVGAALGRAETLRTEIEALRDAR